MKKLTCLCAILLLSVATNWAADNFLIKIRGHIITPDGRSRVRESDLVLSGDQRLVLRVDTTNHTFDIVQTDITGTNQVLRQETHAENAAVSASHRQVTFDLQENEGFDGNIALFPEFTGRMIASGRISRVRGKARSIRLNVFGVWNPNNNSTFKAVITGQRVP